MKDSKKRAGLEENKLKKLANADVINCLQERLKRSIQIHKQNPDDEHIDQYQSGRQTELRYCITLLLTPLERYKKAKSTNPTQFLLSKKRVRIKN